MAGSKLTRARRVLLTTLVGTAAVVGSPTLAGARSTGAARRALQGALSQDLQNAGGTGAAYVVDLNTGKPLYGSSAGEELLPASVEKLYTTSTALLRFGASARLITSVYGRGYMDRHGTWHGTLFIRGGGDPTFGSASFDSYAYGTGATMERLVRNLIRATGIRALKGKIVGDESYFDSVRGTPATGYVFSPYLEGSLSAIVFNRGLTDGGADYVMHPATFAAQQFASTLQADGVKVPSNTVIYPGYTPSHASRLAIVRSPDVATLLQLTNTPSDNFFAEMLLKGIGARFGGGGTTARGAAVVRAEIASQFGIHPQLDDGSGLSRDDATSPRQVVALLTALARNTTFVSSLAIAGETGTLQYEMQGTIAQGRCRGKTGTLHDVANLVGYCRARDGHRLVFAFLLNNLGDPTYGHSVEDQMAEAVAGYDG